MSIQSEIERLTQAKREIRQAIQDKGVGVPEGTPFRQYAEKIGEISAMTQEQADARYLQLAGGTVTGDIILEAEKAIKHGASSAQIIMMPNGNIRIEAPLTEGGASAITIGTAGINLINGVTAVIQTSESSVKLKANTDMTGHSLVNLPAPGSATEPVRKTDLDASIVKIVRW